MNPLKYVFTFTFAVFFSIGLMASQTIENNLQSDDRVLTGEPSKVSAAQAVSLFNFFKIETIEVDSTGLGNDLSENRLKAIYDYFLMATKQVIY